MLCWNARVAAVGIAFVFTTGAQIFISTTVLGFASVAKASVDVAKKPLARVPVPVFSVHANHNSLVVRNPVLLTRADVFRTALAGLNGLEAISLGNSLGALFDSAPAIQVSPPK